MCLYELLKRVRANSCRVSPWTADTVDRVGQGLWVYGIPGFLIMSIRYLLFEFSSIGILDFENFQVSVYSTKSEVITNNQG